MSVCSVVTLVKDCLKFNKEIARWLGLIQMSYTDLIQMSEHKNKLVSHTISVGILKGGGGNLKTQ